jgi:hypothetical protein
LAGALAEVALALTFGADGVYSGISESFDSRRHLGSAERHGHDAEGACRGTASPSSTRPIGGRGIHWLNVNPNWGLMVDYHHAKIYSELGATVNIPGKRDDVPISGKDPINNTFDVLEFTDGLNQIFFGGMFRWKHPR